MKQKRIEMVNKSKGNYLKRLKIDKIAKLMKKTNS